MDRIRRPEPLQYDGGRSLGSNMKIPYRMDAEQTRGCLVSPSTSRLTWPPQPSTHGSCRVWRPADRSLQSPSFLPSHQEWYSLFLISSSFSMYLVILLPRKRRHILDMLYCWEMGITMNSGWEWAPPVSLSCHQRMWDNRQMSHASAKETEPGKGSGPGVLPQPVPSLRQHRWSFTAFIPLYYPFRVRGFFLLISPKAFCG